MQFSTSCYKISFFYTRTGKIFNGLYVLLSTNHFVTSCHMLFLQSVQIYQALHLYLMFSAKNVDRTSTHPKVSVLKIVLVKRIFLLVPGLTMPKFHAELVLQFPGLPDLNHIKSQVKAQKIALFSKQIFQCSISCNDVIHPPQHLLLMKYENRRVVRQIELRVEN